MGLDVTPGYYHKPEETAAGFTGEGWLRTGDLGYFDEEGFIHLTGRTKESYRCGGELVMPAEVESVLGRHPGVAQVQVVGLPDPRMGEVGCVCVIPADGERPDPQQLIALAQRELARFKVPRHVLFITEADLPVTVTGRVQKFKLAQLAQDRLALAMTNAAS